MIIRILGEGQYNVSDGAVDELNTLDDALEQAVNGGDDIAFKGALAGLLSAVRDRGERLADDALEPSEAILPGEDASVDEVRELLKDDGVIPG